MPVMTLSTKFFHIFCQVQAPVGKPALAFESFTSPAPQKKDTIGFPFLCLKRVKRCLNKGKNEQKVSNSTYIKQSFVFLFKKFRL